MQLAQSMSSTRNSTTEHAEERQHGEDNRDGDEEGTDEQSPEHVRVVFQMHEEADDERELSR
ncbi:MAG: hypothetical protein P8049_09180 [Gemmatimonadota bacterium]